jgi:hypothetical protein
MNAQACWDEAMKIIFSAETMIEVKKIMGKARLGYLKTLIVFSPIIVGLSLTTLISILFILRP